jgi:hypothetical protein
MRQDMPPKKDRGSKTETLSLRLDPKTKFSLEFVARINGQTLTTIVERAIRASCDQVKIAEGDFAGPYSWQDFWDPEEGVRMLKLLACVDYPSTYDEDDLRRFTLSHWEFFYASEKATTPKRGFVEVLWPKIDEYRRIWQEQRESDYWAAGRAMAAALTNAQLNAPEWPRQVAPATSTQDAKPRTKSFGRGDTDDEIPF